MVLEFIVIQSQFISFCIQRQWLLHIIQLCSNYFFFGKLYFNVNVGHEIISSEIFKDIFGSQYLGHFTVTICIR